MTETQARSLRDLVSAHDAPLSPVQASEQDMRDMANGERLRVTAVDHKENEQYGGIWEYAVIRPDGTAVHFGLWDNVDRDQTSVTLMTFCQDGPVDDVLLVNKGSDKKPFYVLVPA